MTFEEFIAERGQALLRLACVLTSDSFLAQDIAQEALAKTYRQWEKVRKSKNPEAYVNRILINGYIDSTRRKSATETPIRHRAAAGAFQSDADTCHCHGELPCCARYLRVTLLRFRSRRSLPRSQISPPSPWMCGHVGGLTGSA